MEGKRFIHRIKVQNLLSFDEEGIDLELQPLNVLIGANGSGKSNFLDVFRILQATPTEFTRPFIDSGVVTDWLRRKDDSETHSAKVLTYCEDTRGEWKELLYQLHFNQHSERTSIELEAIVAGKDVTWKKDFVPIVSRRPQGAFLDILRDSEGQMIEASEYPSIDLYKIRQPLGVAESLLKKLKNRTDPEIPLTEAIEAGTLADIFGSIRIYQNWTLGRNAAFRKPQGPDTLGGYLSEDFSNIAAVLSDWSKKRVLHNKLVGSLKDVYSRITDVKPLFERGSGLWTHFAESGVDNSIPINHISDGTIRYLCLLLILLHPEPPKVVCIEEPELGLHPDMIHKVAELLIDASKRMQLIITTHSDLLVSALSEVPESIVVCEHDGKGTRMERLEPEELQGWLKQYNGNLGELWLRGHIGGTRW